LLTERGQLLWRGELQSLSLPRGNSVSCPWSDKRLPQTGDHYEVSVKPDAGEAGCGAAAGLVF